MAASTKENLKINKHERKFIKKLNKAKYTLLKHEGIGTSDNPTQVRLYYSTQIRICPKMYWCPNLNR